LEKEKFHRDVYEAQMSCLHRLEQQFTEVVYLNMKNVDRLFSTLSPEYSLFLTTSDEMAEQMQHLGYAVAGLEPEGTRMQVPPVIFLDLTETTYEDWVRIYQRQHQIPWEILATPRCRIRELGMEDLEALEALYAKPDMTEFIEPLYPPEEERAYQEEYIKNIYGFYGFGMWLVFDKATGNLIGRAGIEARENCRPGEVELGYVFAPEVRRQGIATEVCQAILDYTKEVLEMKHILCRVDEHNVPSRKFLSKLGFSCQAQGKEVLYCYDLCSEQET
jgi:RimJ/RimL family protein N-acetyltransferase